MLSYTLPYCHRVDGRSPASLGNVLVSGLCLPDMLTPAIPSRIMGLSELYPLNRGTHSPELLGTEESMLAWSTVLGSAPRSQGSLLGKALAPTCTYLPPWLTGAQVSF